MRSASMGLVRLARLTENRQATKAATPRIEIVIASNSVGRKQGQIGKKICFPRLPNTKESVRFSYVCANLHYINSANE